jgi:predicted nucleic acid-binding protein
MLAIADTSPLCYLQLLGRMDILPRLFTRVMTTQTVISELRDARSPERVRQIGAMPPAWLEISEVQERVDPEFSELDPGEASALQLSLEFADAVVLLDERSAREAAAKRRIKVMGTIGLLRVASNEKLLDLQQCISDLRRTNFRLSPGLWKTLENQFLSS